MTLQETATVRQMLDDILYAHCTSHHGAPPSLTLSQGCITCQTLLRYHAAYEAPGVAPQPVATGRRR
jgi:hypothetical protein